MYTTSDTKELQKKPLGNRLAVFEQIPCKEKSHKKDAGFKKEVYKRSRDSSDDLVIDIEDEDTFALQPQKKRSRGVRLEVEPLMLFCNWKDCQNRFSNYDAFSKHLDQHIDNIDGLFPCLWDNCDYATPMWNLIRQHVSFHGYHTKLKNIGSNFLARNRLPECLLDSDFIIPEKHSYTCDWLGCDACFFSIYEFHEHIKVHINSNPKYCAKEEIIPCLWKGCTLKFSSQYKLCDHLRSHTKERVVACPTCGGMFATKTKFYDHRKRQLPIERQSYQCSQCSKLFPSERILRDHMRSHINHYKCLMCDMTCTKPSILATHMRYRHLNDRPLKCDTCNHRCVAKQDMEAHLITHLEEKQMACQTCDFRCRSMHGLDRHYQKVHKDGWTPVYECHCCQMKFNRGNALTKHLISKHDFHWPSGHSRFRYKENTDGVFRLQTVRYESIEVTEEMMLTNSSLPEPSSVSLPEPSVSGIRYNLRKRPQPSDKSSNLVLIVAENGEQNVVCPTDNSILITINDVDESGNVLNCEIIQSNEMQVMGSDIAVKPQNKSTDK